ncbi:proteasome maturation factor UMP1 [Tilletiaria anomala UBC 951]|uniref:Proteasome maturation factor UMP1 n=1 Tax=Tilletiaria anomala (strain ATCC 24038 / CBS 436.72 / UBC 951) TaxID=1037660 RepID=A0A066VG73_TILAU|nr:proteasome maturation factor UMP1 [Tilletiaria anomala UBC 951]KDN37580.1 proteasome maturation factor UMP1 [Tilletiaria anomala UBC 951]
MSAAAQQPDRPYAIVPTAHAAATSTSTSETSHPVHKGIHDTMRYGPRSLAFETASNSSGAGGGVHPLQNRLEQWDETRDRLNLNLQRNMYGLGAPLRLLMDRRIASYNPHFPSRQVSNFHLDILNGRDESIEPVDFLPSEIGSEIVDIHAQMEKKHKI